MIRREADRHLPVEELNVVEIARIPGTSGILANSTIAGSHTTARLTTRTPAASTEIRSLFLSDLHLGFRHSRVRSLLDFLVRCEPENLYLVGDFIDGWCFRNRWHWQPECNLVVARLMDLAQRGTRIRLAIGNHDNFLRDPMMQRFIQRSGIAEVAEEFHHNTADGRKFMVLHGDQFDDYERASSFTVGFLNCFYEGMLRANSLWSCLTSTALHGQGSLVARIKRRLHSVGRHARHYRDRVVRHTRHRGFDGVICGHIHDPQHIDIDGITYCNAGDWVENCSALVEDSHGKLRLVWL
jgi:UDP-2,3-diacylglucosamine pyrophosphatase LpxH